MLQQIDTSVLSMRKLGVIVFGCWTLLRFKECMVKTLMDESIQVPQPTALHVRFTFCMLFTAEAGRRLAQYSV